MNIIDCYYILDGNLDAKQRKATEFFLEQNLVKLFGQAEFEEEEAKVMITPNSIEITNNVYGDETTKDIVIEVFKNGLVGRSLVNDKLLFGIKRDNNHIIDLYHNMYDEISEAYVCQEDKFGYTVKDSYNGEILFDGMMSAVGSRDKASESFYLEVFTPKQEKKSLFGKKGANGFVDVPIDAYTKMVDEYDYLGVIFEVLENQREKSLSDSRTI